LDKDAISGRSFLCEEHEVPDFSLQADVRDKTVHVLRVDAWRIGGIGISIGIPVLAVEEVNEVVAMVHVDGG
jgi:hypothetical protein